MRYHFGDFELDTHLFTLTRKGESQHVEPLVFDLIQHLVHHPGEVISRDDLMRAVWNGRIVSDATIAGCIKAARKALGDSGDKQSFIETVRGRGIKFVAPTHIEEPQRTTETQTTVVRSPRSKLPSLIVLPFDTFQSESTDNSEIEHLANGFVENLTTVLTRIPLLQVAARSTRIDLKGKPRRASDIHSQLGIDFMLEGSLQQVEGKIRASIQLIDTEGGFHLWAQQFDTAADGDLINLLLNEIVAALEPQLVRGIIEQIKQDENEPGGKQLLLQAMGLLSLRGWHRDTFEESTALLEKALIQEPDLALARAYLSLILGLGHRVGLLEKSSEVADRAEQEAELALRLDNYDSATAGLAGCALADIGQPERALPVLKNAIKLNPNNGQAWAALGSAQTLIGQHQSAIENLRKGIEISPADNSRAVWCAILSIAYLLASESNSAIDAAEEGILYDQRNYLPRVALAGAWLMEKNTRNATDAMTGAVQAKPDLSQHEINSIVGIKVGKVLHRLSRAK